jgi:hypothetical protein
MREYTSDMGEISGFGGSYEQGCRCMVLAGLAWWDAHPDADPKFKGFKEVFGLIVEDNDDAKALTQAMMDAPISINGEMTTVGKYGATGAMHQACINHIFAARKLGWDGYRQEMQKKEVGA